MIDFLPKQNQAIHSCSTKTVARYHIPSMELDLGKTATNIRCKHLEPYVIQLSKSYFIYYLFILELSKAAYEQSIKW